jgi:hypothetical protein
MSWRYYLLVGLLLMMVLVSNVQQIVVEQVRIKDTQRGGRYMTNFDKKLDEALDKSYIPAVLADGSVWEGQIDGDKFKPILQAPGPHHMKDQYLHIDKNMNIITGTTDTTALLQVTFYTPNGEYVVDSAVMDQALLGSPYVLDMHNTESNEAMVIVKTEQEAERLMQLGEIILPSGFKMEIEVP